jgi:predicted adenine nucleotide alpha hydrolase (AANH) superfamily ATPase
VKILLHTCCGPCAIYPVDTLRREGCEVMAFFYRHNIHPYRECLRRQEALAQYAEGAGLRVLYQKGYEIEAFLQGVAFRESSRCLYCYRERLQATALMARRGKFDSFTSTLLYSRHQQHDTIKLIGDSVAKTVGIPFLYRDFREGWQHGIEVSKQLGLYRQNYCGCIYSEKERFFRRKT